MHLFSLDNAWLAFLAGLITSPHCLVMCGPIAFAFLAIKKNSPTLPFIPQLTYHLGRIFSYTLLGFLLAQFSYLFLNFFQLSTLRLLPWLVVLFLLIFTTGVDQLIPKLPFANTFFSKISFKLTKLPKPLAGFLLGLFTPLLPCGPLYIVFWTSLLSGSPTFAAQICLGFAIGTIPLMLLTGTQLSRLSLRINPVYVHRAQRILAATAAAFIIWRMLYSDSPLLCPICQ